MNAPYTAFGKTKNVPVVVWKDLKPVPLAEKWDTTLWIERGEDWYALEAPGYRGKAVRIIERNAWLRATPVAEQSTGEDAS